MRDESFAFRSFSIPVCNPRQVILNSSQKAAEVAKITGEAVK